MASVIEKARSITTPPRVRECAYDDECVIVAAALLRAHETLAWYAENAGAFVGPGDPYVDEGCRDEGERARAVLRELEGDSNGR